MDCAAEATMGYVAPVLTDTKVLETIMMVLRKAPNMRVFCQVVGHLIKRNLLRMRLPPPVIAVR